MVNRNFINPGTMLLGIGVDFDLTPTLRVTLNANQIWFENTSSVSAVRNQGVVDKNLGPRPFTLAHLSAAYDPERRASGLRGNHARRPWL